MGFVNTLYVRGFRRGINAEDISPDFEKFGTVERVDLPPTKTPDGPPYAFVEFAEKAEAETALANLHDKPLSVDPESILIVEWARSEPHPSGSGFRGGRGGFRGGRDFGYPPRGGYDRGYPPRRDYDRGYPPRGGYDRGYPPRRDYDRGYPPRDDYRDRGYSSRGYPPRDDRRGGYRDDRRGGYRRDDRDDRRGDYRRDDRGDERGDDRIESRGRDNDGDYPTNDRPASRSRSPLRD